MFNTPDVVVEVKVPKSLLTQAGLSQQEISDALLRAYILSLYQHDAISTGKAARLLDIHRLTFIRMLADEGIPYLDYSDEELESELEALRQWRTN